MILDGEGEMTVGEESGTVKSGDTIFIPSNYPHGLINTGTNILRYISAGSPVFGEKKEKQYWPLMPDNFS